MQGGLKNQFDCIRAFSETDFTEDLETFDVPTLIIHGDDDQIVPIGPSAHASSCGFSKRRRTTLFPSAGSSASTPTGGQELRNGRDSISTT